MIKIKKNETQRNKGTSYQGMKPWHVEVDLVVAEE